MDAELIALAERATWTVNHAIESGREDLVADLVDQYLDDVVERLMEDVPAGE